MSAADIASETGSRIATCTNPGDCSKARAYEAIEWYPGAGEYCPDCGEALTLDDNARPQPSSDGLPRTEAPATSGANIASPPESGPALQTIAGQTPPHHRKTLRWNRRWFWVISVVLAAGALIIYSGHRPIAAQRNLAESIEICAIPSAQQLAGDIMRGFAAKSGLGEDRFVVRNGSVCDVRFSSAAAKPDAVIARDGIVAIVNPLNPISRISEKELRAIYNGSIRDWAQVGGRPGEIVALMPADASDEAKAIVSSVLFGAAIDSRVNRQGSSVDVTRAVTGADRTSRGSIGLVAFSQSIPAKVLPLAYLPPPSVLSIGTRRYPYILTIAVETGSDHAGPDARRLVDFAKSSEGAQLVAKDGLVGRGDL